MLALVDGKPGSPHWQSATLDKSHAAIGPGLLRCGK